MARHSLPDDAPGDSTVPEPGAPDHGTTDPAATGPVSPYEAAHDAAQSLPMNADDDLAPADSAAPVAAPAASESAESTAPAGAIPETVDDEEDIFDSFEPAWAPTGVLAAAAGTAAAPSSGREAARASATSAKVLAEDTTRSKHVKKKRPASLGVKILGVVGELLITMGVFIGLFIVWQVWWTDIEANKVQAEAVQEFEKKYGEVTLEEQGIGEPQTSEPPAFKGGAAEGDILGIMHIPTFGYDYAYTIKEGTGLRDVLDTGAYGRYTQAAQPGGIGNFATAAHRQSYGAPMRDVQNLEVGDPIVVETQDAWLVYKVVDWEIVTPSDWRVVAPDPFEAKKAVEAGGTPNDVTTEPTRRLLTITTCHPLFVSNERWAVHAEFSHWVARADGVPQELVDPKEAN